MRNAPATGQVRNRNATAPEEPEHGPAGCDVELWITGWHADDTRYIAHCAGELKGDFRHLAGEWWQLKGKSPPSDL